MVRFLAFVAFLLLAAGGLRGVAEEAGVRAEAGERVVEIDLHGLLRTAEGTVLGLLKTQRGEAFVPEAWQEDLEALRSVGLFARVEADPPALRPGGVALSVWLLEHPLVADLVFEGNVSLAAAELRKSLQTAPGRPFSLGETRTDLARIRGQYAQAKMGIQSADVRLEWIGEQVIPFAGREIRQRPEVRVIFAIQEAPPVVLSSVSFEGQKVVERGVLEEAWPLDQSAVYFSPRSMREALRTAEQRISALYLDRGYIFSEIRCETQPDPAGGVPGRDVRTVKVHIHEGAQHLLEAVEITGNLRVETAALLQALNQPPGLPYKHTEFESGIRALRALCDQTIGKPCGLRRSIRVAGNTAAGNAQVRVLLEVIEPPEPNPKGAKPPVKKKIPTAPGEQF